MTTGIPRIFDRTRAEAKWARARSRQDGGGASYLSQNMADDIAERLDFMRVEVEQALVVGDAQAFEVLARDADQVPLGNMTKSNLERQRISTCLCTYLALAW